VELWALVMFVAAVVLLLFGYPVAFTLGAVAMLFGTIFLGIDFFDLLPLRIWGIMTNFTLLAVPLFVFMGVLLEKSGLAEDLLETMGMLFGRVRGGLAVAIVVVGALLAATTGVVGATVVTMAVIALPSFLKHRYDPALASGTIAAAGTLGQIIPPSIILILLADVVGVPVGQLFMGAAVPGLLLVVAFIVYVLIIAWLRPAMAPPVDRTRIARIVQIDGAAETLGARVAKSLLPPLVLVIAVLGSIFFGIASPTESAAVGALGAMLLAATHRRMTLVNLRAAARQTTRLTSMVFLILVGATAFGLVFRGMGGDILVEDVMAALPGGQWSFLAVSMAVIFVLGFFLDFLEICFIVVPILAPIADVMGINLLWFAVLVAMNLQTSFLTPPFGFSLFYLKAAAPAEIRIQQIYRGIVPFVVLQLIVLGLLLAYPGLTLWLPRVMDRLQGL
jgi:tripartite ATP-independent transporter DctM subunit